MLNFKFKIMGGALSYSLTVQVSKVPFETAKKRPPQGERWASLKLVFAWQVENLKYV
jgi:hypothetical protein